MACAISMVESSLTWVTEGDWRLNVNSKHSNNPPEVDCSTEVHFACKMTDGCMDKMIIRMHQMSLFPN